ncbi:hypothetical protein Q7P37_011631 [Cladosporium fusiforme]
MHPKPFLAAAASTLLLAPSTLAAGLYNKASPVIQVGSKDFDSQIKSSNHTSIVEFYAPWCGHCKNLAPAFEKAAKSLSGLAKVAAVNCDEEANKPLCGQMGVQGFPTLKIVRPGKKAGRPAIEDYQGARNAKAIVEAVKDKIPNHVTRLKDSEVNSWAEKDGPKAILFSDKGVVSALVKALAIDFLGAIDVAQIRNKETQTVKKYGIDKFPTLVLLPGDGKDPIKYDGELKKEPMLAFLSKAASPNPDPAPKKSKADKKEKSKSSKASSSFSKASASHASSEGSASPASQTDETLDEESNPTASPDPKVNTAQKPMPIPAATPIPSLPDGLSLQQKCLNDKASTCILALLPPSDDSSSPEDTTSTTQAITSLSEIHHKHESAKRKLFPFYQLPSTNSQATALRTLLSLPASTIELIALNGKRNWYRHFDASTGLSTSTLEAWIDAIRMDDLAKAKLPENIIVPRDALPAEEVQYEKPAAAAGGAESMHEQLKNSMPEGVDFEFEEIDDDEYDRIIKQQNEKAAAAEAEKKADEHDEL